MSKLNSIDIEAIRCQKFIKEYCGTIECGCCVFNNVVRDHFFACAYGSDHPNSYLCPSDWNIPSTKPQITQAEKDLMGILAPEFREGWICMNEDGEVCVYQEKPVKIGCLWQCIKGFYGSISSVADGLLTDFSFSWMSWDDEEPWYIPDLLKED